MADQNDLTTNVALYEEGKSQSVTSTTDDAKERLDVSVVDLTDPRKGSFINQALENGGSDEINVDGDPTPVSFTANPNTGKNLIVYRLIIVMEDASMSWTKFAGRSALTNGLLIKVTEDGIERTIITDPIKTNRDFVWNAYDVSIDNATTAVLSMRWTFNKAGTVLTLKDAESDNLKIIVQDDLTGVSYFKATAQGYEIDE
jgi:hypothetical protein